MREKLTQERWEGHRVDYGPTIQSTARTGKAKFWRAGIVWIESLPFLIKEWWQDDTVSQWSTPRKVKPKNVGKANETSYKEQAESELDSLYQKQRDKGYSETGSAQHIYMKPMLAHKFTERKKDIVYPCFVQPKLDGVRMLMDGKRAWSRGGKDFIPEVVAHLMFDTKGYVLDGELIVPGNAELQITSRAYKSVNEDNVTLHYYVYDIADASGTLTYTERKAVLDAIFNPRLSSNVPLNVHLHDTRTVTSEDMITRYKDIFVSEGFEGVIVRNAQGKYEQHRSPNLQKLKDFQDAEFLVVDIRDGEGSFEGMAICVCAAPNGSTFEAVPKGPMEYKAHVFRHKKQYIGKYLTVRYQYLSQDGIPVGNTVGVAFRDKGEF